MSHSKPPRKQRPVEKAGLKLRVVSPLTPNQSLAFDSYNAGDNLLMIGSAGTGKSFLSLYLGLASVTTGDQEKVVVVRSAVPVRDMGFLPGNAREKAEAYEAPYRAMSAELYGRGDAYDMLKAKGALEFMTTSFIRGTTIRNSVIIVDEIQNCSDQELHSIMTRVGEGCRIIFCGDTAQTDLPRKESGFQKFVSIISSIESFRQVCFKLEDIVRSDLVKSYLIAREKYEGLLAAEDIPDGASLRRHLAR